MSVTQWLQERLWNPMGAEYSASMMVDRNDAAGVEHLESGLTATAHDLAKFGQLFLQDGVWNGEKILPEGWVESSTGPGDARTDKAWCRYYRNRPSGRFLESGHIYYRRFWWGNRLDDGRHDYFAMGVLGQHIYVAPDSQTVIVRLSDRFPSGIWWPPIFRQIVDAVDHEHLERGRFSIAETGDMPLLPASSGIRSQRPRIAPPPRHRYLKRQRSRAA
jgi:CubicO group peptidase (beta-lactamase class C family)